MRELGVVTAALALFVTGSAEARTPRPTNSATPQAVARLLACRALTDPAQRLACFDRETGAVSQAIATKDLVVIDRARVVATKRELFGYSIPSFGGLFGGGENDVKQIESTVTAWAQNAEGGWIIRLADKTEWSQIDDNILALPPRRGDKVVVQRGTLGSFWLMLGKQPGIKVKRVA